LTGDPAGSGFLSHHRAGKQKSGGGQTREPNEHKRNLPVDANF
jgi:hypothetical protein